MVVDLGAVDLEMVVSEEADLEAEEMAEVDSEEEEKVADF